MAAEQPTALTNVKVVFFPRENASVAILAADIKQDVVYTISLVRSSDRVDTPGMPEAKSE